jgi:hypothetical protein
MSWFRNVLKCFRTLKSGIAMRKFSNHLAITVAMFLLFKANAVMA